MEPPECGGDFAVNNFALIESKNAPLPIDPSTFVDRMEARWTKKLENISSMPLRHSWAQVCEAFNSAIHNHNEPLLSKNWVVVQLPTGSGKTQGVIVYCGMLSEMLERDHPGVLIVTRRKADADAIAEEINIIAGEERAISHHSDSKMEAGELQKWPVLVVTHRAYVMALSFIARGMASHSKLPHVMSWNDGDRKLVVIDEAIDIVEEFQVSVEELRQTLAAVSDLQEGFPKEIKFLRATVEMLEDKDLGDCEAVLFNQPIAIIEETWRKLEEGRTHFCLRAEKPPDLHAFTQALKHIFFDKQIGITDPKERDRLRKLHASRIESLQMISRTFMLKARVDGHLSIIASQLLLPECTRSALIMDATASANPVYELLDGVTVLPRHEGVRLYTSVTLHVTRGHRVGKDFMRKNVQKLCKGLIADLNVRLPGRSVLVVSHKELEATLQSLETTFDMHTAHWGRLTGSNEWRKCDAVVIFGLPYRPPIQSANICMGLMGPQDTDWLKDSGRRAFGQHGDIRRSIEVGSMVVDLVQAINRARCRIVIDELGNCPPTDIFIWLPSGKIAEELLNGISLQMPGIRIECFTSSESRRKPKQSKHELGLITYIRNMVPGRHKKSDVQKAIGASPTTMKSLVKNMQDVESPIAKAMAEARVKYETPREGRSRIAYLHKE